MTGAKEEDTRYNKAAEKCAFFYCSINSAWINSNNSVFTVIVNTVMFKINEYRWNYCHFILKTLSMWTEL